MLSVGNGRTEINAETINIQLRDWLENDIPELIRDDVDVGGCQQFQIQQFCRCKFGIDRFSLTPP
jgi:hypothetical protein